MDLSSLLKANLNVEEKKTLNIKEWLLFNFIFYKTIHRIISFIDIKDIF